MQFTPANVVDVLRSSHHDEAFLREVQNNVQQFTNLLGNRNAHNLRRILPGLTKVWYHFMTTYCNLQTLGEEYSGTLRLDRENRVPSKLNGLIWLAFCIGGESLVKECLMVLKQKVDRSKLLTKKAQGMFGKLLNFWYANIQTMQRIHQSLFYIDGKYPAIPYRLTGIKYVLVRHWLQDETFTLSFRVLGYLSLFYSCLSCIQQVWSQRSNGNILEVSNNEVSEVSSKTCMLCADYQRNSSATPCGHIFCWECIHDSLAYQQVCPACREVVLPSRIIPLQNYV